MNWLKEQFLGKREIKHYEKFSHSCCKKYEKKYLEIFLTFLIAATQYSNKNNLMGLCSRAQSIMMNNAQGWGTFHP